MVTNLEDIKLHQNPLPKLMAEKKTENHPDLHTEPFKITETSEAGHTSDTGTGYMRKKRLQKYGESGRKSSKKR